MKTKINSKDGLSMVQLIGSLDTVASETFTEEILKLIEEGNTNLLLDCSALEYISSTGLRSMLTILKKITSIGGKLVIKSLSTEVKEVFDMTGFSNMFTIEA